MTGEQPHSIRAEQRVLDAMMAAVDPATIDAVAEITGRVDFYQERHAELFDTVLSLRKEGAPTSADAVAERLLRRDPALFERIGGGAYLATIIDLTTPPAQGTYWATIVAGHAATRAAIGEALRYKQIVEEGEPEQIAAARSRLVEDWTASTRRSSSGPRAMELDAFLAAEEPDHDWLIPGLLDRGDRVILTGSEGSGKSTLLRQLGVQAASGIHPFGGEDFPPVRVLRLDVENGARMERNKMRALRLAAGERYAGGMFVESRIEGLDLTQQADGDWLLALAAEHDPDLFITGPAYRMHAGDPTEEVGARIVAGYFDRIRKDYGAALLLEAHSPHAANGGKRPLRPYGASYWLRWPEFGLCLFDDEEEGWQLRHWRGPRDERDWPEGLQRGGLWPWTATAGRDDRLWTDIRDLCRAAGRRLSQRVLASKLGVGKTTIQRTIDAHRADWYEMGGDEE